MKKLFALMTATILLISGFGSAETLLVESEDPMANIPQVNVGGTVYNLKDTAARSALSAETFDPNKVYYAGEFAYRNDTLYRRKASTFSADGSWMAGRWVLADVSAVTQSLSVTNYPANNENALFNAKTIIQKRVYNTSLSNNDDFIVFVVPVSSGVTYYSNKEMRFVSKIGTNITQNVSQFTAQEDFDAIITFPRDDGIPFYILSTGSNFYLTEPLTIFQSDAFDDDQRILDERNLLNHAIKIKRGYYYNGSQGGETQSSGYSYTVINVKNGQTIYVKHARFLSKASAKITDEVTDYAYTADYTGKLFITLYNRDLWIVSNQEDLSVVSPYNAPSFTAGNLAQTTGSDTARPMSQAAVTDALQVISAEGSIYAALLSTLSGKKIAQFGDSIIQGDGSENAGPGELLATKYGMTIYEYAVGGATMGVLSGKTHIIDEVNQAAAAGIEPDIIIFDGGTNDMHGTTPNCPLGTVSTVYTEPAASNEFSNGFESVAYKIKSTWPEAMVIYIRAHNMSSRAYDRQISYGERGIEIAEKWGFGVIDMYKRMNSQLAYYETYVPDHTHPNVAGYEKYYVPAIEQYLYERRNELN